MAKRFTETGKWKKKWIRELNPDMKLFWFYLLDNCDHAGVWEVDIDLASFQIGVKLDEARILKVFNRKIVPFKDGKWFIPKFIDYQYGELNEKVNAHKSVIKLLTKYGLYVENQQLGNSWATVKVNTLTVKDKDIYKDKKKSKITLLKKDKILCAKFRKGHFEGVLDVMNRLTKIVNPQKIFMGEKDFQQLILVKKYIENNFKSKIVLCKTIRDKNKLALSSRNLLLKKRDQIKAGKIAKTLISFKKKLRFSKFKSCPALKSIIGKFFLI